MASLGNRMETEPGALGTHEIREDLANYVSIIDPVDTPFYSNCGSEQAGSVHVEWLQDSLAAINTDGHGEGVALSAASVSRPGRADNWQQIIRKDYGISDSEEAVIKAGIDNAFAYQTMKKLREMARDSEASMIRNTRITTNTTTAPMKMDGLATFIQTNTDIAATATLSQDQFSALQEIVYLVSGIQPETCLLSPRHKRAVSTWYTNIFREVGPGGTGTVLGTSITNVLTDFGPVDFIMERYTRVINVTTDELYLIAMNQCKKCWLIPTKAERQARDGDITPGMVMHQLTLKVNNEATCGRLTANRTLVYPT